MLLNGEVVSAQVFGLSLWFVMLSTNIGNIDKEMPITLIPISDSTHQPQLWLCLKFMLLKE